MAIKNGFLNFIKIVLKSFPILGTLSTKSVIKFRWIKRNGVKTGCANNEEAAILDFHRVTTPIYKI